LTKGPFGHIIAVSTKESAMGYFSNLELDIESMAADGYSPAEIAERLEIPFEDVVAVLEKLEEEGYDDDYDGQPTELEEWMDFDPDC
jgi:hypothetical protein